MARRKDKAPPSFPLYYKDAYTDAAFLALGWDAQGLFWRLACWQWDDGDVPADVELAIAIVGKPASTRRLWPTMLQFFLPVEGKPGRIRNARTHELREEMLARRAKNREGADKTNEKRWGHADAEVGDPTPPAPPVEQKPLTPQQEAVKLVLDAFEEQFRPAAGLAARWIGQVAEGRGDPNPIPAAEIVRELVWKYPQKGAEYIAKCVGTTATQLRTGNAQHSTGRTNAHGRGSNRQTAGKDRGASPSALGTRQPRRVALADLTGTD
jgi:hypothetical protein